MPQSETPNDNAGTPPAPLPRPLEELRREIDSLDRRLVLLLNERAGLVVEVGASKRASGSPIYAPHRESEVLARVLAMNAGPLAGRTIEGIYREIMSGSFALERGLCIAFLGPKGSFSHLASVRHFGQSVTFEETGTIDAVFTAVSRGHADYGLVPIENSIHGGVVETLDALVGFAGRVHLYAEVQLEVHHALASHCEPDRITRVFSKPEVFTQCRNWLVTNLPRATLTPTPSSSRAVQMVAEEFAADPANATSAAIGSTLAADLYDVPARFANIEDDPNNLTRFFVLAREQARPSGDDKTTVMFKTLDKPGALAAVLHDFERSGINLTHIDKRPAGRVNWTYTFFIDAQGHKDDPVMQLAIERAKQHCQELVVLGSFPRSQRVL